MNEVADSTIEDKIQLLKTERDYLRGRLAKTLDQQIYLRIEIEVLTERIWALLNKRQGG